MLTLEKFHCLLLMVFVFSGPQAKVAAAPVRVSSSAGFAVALVNPNTSEVLVNTALESSGVRHSHEHDAGLFLVLHIFTSSDIGYARG